MYLLFIAQHHATVDVVVWCGKEFVKCAVYAVVLSLFHFYRQYGEAFVVVDEEIHLSFLLVVIIVEREPVCMQFLSYSRLVYRSQVYAALIFQHSLDVCSVKQVGQQSYIAEVQFQKILAFRLGKWKFRVADGIHRQCNSGIREIFKLFSVVAELLV